MKQKEERKASAAVAFNNPLEYLGIFSGFDTYAFNTKDNYYQLKHTDNTWSMLCKGGYLIITNIVVVVILNTHLRNL
jgi:hypothetical protein